MKLPQTIYFATVDYPKAGVGIADFYETAMDAYIHCAVPEGVPLPFRLFRMDFDVETNAFEAASEITEDFITQHADWLAIAAE